MSTTIQTIPLVPIPVPTEIPVITPPQLVEPIVNSADYSLDNQTLTVSVTLDLPKNVSPTSIVLYQYIDPSNLFQLQFYFLYQDNGSTSLKPYTYTFNASEVNSSGQHINLSKIATVYNMLRNSGPKTSRGTVTSVRSIGGYVGDGGHKK